MLVLDYPKVVRGDHSDTFHGVEVPDPYRSLGQDTPHTRAWFAKQQALSAAFFAKVGDAAALTQRLDGVPDFIPTRAPLRAGEAAYEFATSTNGGLKCVRLSDGKVVFDPATIPAIAEMRLEAAFCYLSPDGRYLAAGMSVPGENWDRMGLWDLQEQRLVGDLWPHTVELFVTWLPDSSGFYYNLTRTQFGLSDMTDGVYRHRLGEDQSKDALVFDHTGRWGHAALPVTLADGRLLIKVINFVTNFSELWTLDADGSERQLLDVGPRYDLLGQVGDEILLDTYRGTDRGQVIALDVNVGQPSVRVVVPEQAADTLAVSNHSTHSLFSTYADGRLFLSYVRDAANRVRVFGLDGSDQGELSLPHPVTVEHCQAGRGFVEFVLTSFVAPFERYQVDTATLAVTRAAAAHVDIDLASTETTQFFFTSPDGVRVPMFLVRPAGTTQPLPTLLYAYGGWGQSITPQFRKDLALWLSLGGAYAVVNARGGGEYGREWHLAGKDFNKKNTFIDVCAAGDELIARGIAPPGGLCLRGLSNGALVGGAVVNLRPELFRAVALGVPLLDVVHLMQMKYGSSIAGEFGDPTSDKATFENLLSYSPLQNLKATAARPALFLTAGGIDESAPLEWTARYVAMAQATSEPGQIALLHVIPGEGHAQWPNAVDNAAFARDVAFLWAAATGGLSHIGTTRDAV
jgi:prolyl oligopeptidase